MRNVGPEQRTGRNSAEKENPLYVHWGIQWDHPWVWGACGEGRRDTDVAVTTLNNNSCLYSFWAHFSWPLNHGRHWEPQAGLSRYLSLSHLGWEASPVWKPLTAPPLTCPLLCPVPGAPHHFNGLTCWVLHFNKWESLCFLSSLESFNWHCSQRNLHTLLSRPYGCLGT